MMPDYAYADDVELHKLNDIVVTIYLPYLPMLRHDTI
jgi:hypothetical protein